MVTIKQFNFGLRVVCISNATQLILVKYLTKIFVLLFLISSQASTPLFAQSAENSFQLDYSGGAIQGIQKDGTCFVLITGKIQNDIESAFDKALYFLRVNSCSEKIVLLNSRGGNLGIAMKLGKAIRREGITTQINGECDSACGFIFIAGAHRLVDLDGSNTIASRFKVHQPTAPTISGINRCANNDYLNSPLVATVKTYLKSMLPDTSAQYLLRVMMSVKCEDELNIEARSLLDFRVATGLGVPFIQINVEQAKALITKNGCSRCHSLDGDKSGPSFQKIAHFYRGKPGAKARLYEHFTSGENAKFIDDHLEPHPIVKTTPENDQSQIDNLANWVLAQ
jgi:cytochrome c